MLARYPPEATLPCENVADYCFPQGIRAARIDARESQSSLNKVLFQPGACQRGSQSFVFMFSGAAQRSTDPRGPPTREILQMQDMYEKIKKEPPGLRNPNPIPTPPTQIIQKQQRSANSIHYPV